jgi:peptidoglycan-associated lipoprotein
MPSTGAPFLGFLGLCSLVLGLGSACGPTYPNCGEDSECHQGEYCVNGRCQLCRGDADCPTGQSCASGRCEPTAGYCTSAGQCQDGEECRENRCTRVASTQTDLPPPTGEDPPGASPCDIAAVYFEFESNDLGASTRDQLQTVARCMRERNYAHLHLTGACDPRGTEEYNLALGDRRARAVRDYLQSLGVEPGKLSVSSTGEEFARGEDESGWSRDRNVGLEAR